MRFLFYIGIVLLLFSCKVKQYDGMSSPIPHDTWTDLLKKHVTQDGWVDYEGFKKDSATLDQYLNTLSSHHPNDNNWTPSESMAYWINAYNAYTVKLIIDHYPTPSIKDIKKGIPFVNSVWDIKFITIEDRTYDLNNIEHGILRKHFTDARIHFAINCASYSCPALLNEAYTAEHLEEQLDRAARLFINDHKRNIITKDELQLSKIFKWFGGDFKRNGDLKEYIKPYSEVDYLDDANVKYLDYDWRLNDISNK